MLEERLERATIRAPFDGVLDERRVEIGSFLTPGTPVARLVDLDTVQVTAGVPERYAADVSVGDRAEVGFDALGEALRTGELTFVGSVVDPDSRTFPVELTLPNPGRRIKPEMIADLSLIRRSLARATVVPQQALVRVEDGFVAFVVEEDALGRTVARRRSHRGGRESRRRRRARHGEGGRRLRRRSVRWGPGGSLERRGRTAAGR